MLTLGLPRREHVKLAVNQHQWQARRFEEKTLDYLRFP